MEIRRGSYFFLFKAFSIGTLKTAVHGVAVMLVCASDNSVYGGTYSQCECAFLLPHDTVIVVHMR